jgi:hypothetical protein
MNYAMRWCSSAETSDMQCVAGNCDVTTATLSATAPAHCCNIQPRPQVQVNKVLTPFAHVHMKSDTVHFLVSNAVHQRVAVVMCS